MAEAFIYDHVRTPRGRGKKDGALHEVSTAVLAAGDAPRHPRPQRPRRRAGRRRDPRLRRSGRRGRRRHRAIGGLRRGLSVFGAGYAGEPLLRLRPRRGEHRPRGDRQRPARHDHRRRRRIDEPHRHRRGRQRLGDRPAGRAARLFRAAGHLGRPDRHQIRLLARRRRRLCGREPEARGQCLGAGLFREVGGAGYATSTA